jgi:hypothetical protein
MKINLRNFIIPALIILLNFNLFAFEKVGTTSFQFLKIMMSARASGLGGAFSSVGNNSEALYWNPAGISRVNSFDASASYVNWFLDAAHYSFAAAYNFEDIGTFGLHAIYTDVGEIEVTKVSALGFVGDVYNPGLTGEVFSPKSFVVGLSYAKDLTDKFSFGITAKYVKDDLIYASADALVFDGGLIFRTGFRSIEVAASIVHFGPEVKFIDKSYPLPQTFNIGISGYLFAPGDHLIGDLANNKLLIAYDLTQPRDYDQQHVVGIEYSFEDILFLRGGYKFNSDQEGISAGGGVHFQNYRVDYSYNDYGDYLNEVHKFTVGFEF